jgi:hypothetical protein
MSSRMIAAAAAALTLVSAPLAAQSTNAMPKSGPRVVATYEFRVGATESSFPRSVTVADSAGTILARVDMGGPIASSIPMTVTVIESNLVLQGETAQGLLTLVLDRQNEGGETKLASGTWTLGRSSGQLRGKSQP